MINKLKMTIIINYNKYKLVSLHHIDEIPYNIIYIVVLNNKLEIEPISIHLSCESAQESLYRIMDNDNSYSIYECNLQLKDDEGNLFADKKNILKKYDAFITSMNGCTYKMLSKPYNGKPIPFTKWIWQTDDEFINNINSFVSDFYKKINNI